MILQTMSIVFLLCVEQAINEYQYHPLPEPYTENCQVGKENKYDPSKASRVTWFTVDLDKPPLERWTEIALKYSTQIKELIEVVKAQSFPFFHGKLIQWVDKHMTVWDQRLPQPYRDEIKGIARTVGLPVGEIILYNIFYEIFSVCTSIVAEDSSGKLYHARNLDFGLWMGWDHKKHEWKLTQRLRQMVININWRRKGKLLFKSNNFAGFIGIYNALRPNTFTLTANERFSADGGYVGLIMWLLGIGDSKWMTWATREVMEHAQSYRDAIRSLSSQKLMSPVFFILAGNATGQGCVITRDRYKTVSTVQLNPSTKNGWYLLQTNYDPDDTPFYLDDRRTPGNICIEKLGRNHLGFKGIFNVLSSTTTLNKLTAYTVLMEVDNSRFETYVQTCPDPCWPF